MKTPAALDDRRAPQQRETWLVRIVVFFVAIILLFRFVVMGVRFNQHDAAVDVWFKRHTAGRLPFLIPVDGSPDPPKPMPAYIRDWFRRTYNASLPRFASKDRLDRFWMRRYSAGVIYVQSRDRIYVQAGRPRHDPPRTPFEVEHDGGMFVFATNRSGKFFSFLVNPVDSRGQYALANAFTMGYTSLIMFTHVRTLLPCTDRPVTAPPQRYPHNSLAHRFAVLRDPLFSAHHQPHSWETVLGCYPTEDEAMPAAAKFVLDSGMAACIARVECSLGWH